MATSYWARRVRPSGVRDSSTALLSEAASAHAPRWGYTFGMYLSFILGATAFVEGRWIWGTIQVVFFFWALIARERIDRAVLGPSPYELKTGVHPECGYRHTK